MGLLSLIACSLYRDRCISKNPNRKPKVCVPTSADLTLPSLGKKLPNRMRVGDKKLKWGRRRTDVEPKNENRKSEIEAENNFEYNAISKLVTKAWIRRVLRRENSSSKPDERLRRFRRRYRIRRRNTDTIIGKFSPTNSKTVTDESSSHYCRSRSEESPRRKLAEQLSFRGAVKFDEVSTGPIHNSGDRTISCNRRYTNYCDCISVEENDHDMNDKSFENSLCIRRQRFSNPDKDRDNQDEAQKFLFQTPGIIDQLSSVIFPTEQTTENISCRDILNMVTKDDQEMRNHLDIPSEKCDGRPTFRSEFIKSLFPMGHPDDKRISETKCKFNFIETVSAPSSCVDDDDDKFIGLVITFDPTWYLLTVGDNNYSATMVKSRLKKFHEIENYDESLLGKISGEGSSEVSTDLNADINLSFGTEALSFTSKSEVKELICEENFFDTFDLGFHFDQKRFPLTDSPEIEICFVTDDGSIDYIRTSRVTQHLEFKEDSGNLRSDLHDHICSQICPGEFSGCVDDEQTTESPKESHIPTINSYSLPRVSSPQEFITSHNLYLFTDKDENDTEYLFPSDKISK